MKAPEEAVKEITQLFTGNGDYYFEYITPEDCLAVLKQYLSETKVVVPTFKSLEKLSVVGKGIVFIVENDCDRDRNNLALVGNKVVIDDCEYIVKGIEAYASATIRKGEKIALIV